MKIIALTGLLLAALLEGASFEVASIKPSSPDARGSDVDNDNGLLRMQNVTVKRCIMRAYGVPEAQIDGPKWIDELRYDIIAKADHAAAGDEIASMLQSLLTDRFQLSFHHETRTLSGYAITVTKAGFKAKPSAPDTPTDINRSPGVIEAKACPIPRLAIRLSQLLSAPVVDATELKGNFDFHLQWNPDELLANDPSVLDSSNSPSLFTALREQLGLKVEKRKILADVLVIDRVDRPSEN